MTPTPDTMDKTVAELMSEFNRLGLGIAVVGLGGRIETIIRTALAAQVQQGELVAYKDALNDPNERVREHAWRFESLADEIEKFDGYERTGYELQSDLYALANKVRALYASPQGVPEGMALVPMEPTPEMLGAAQDTPGMKAVNGFIAEGLNRYGRSRSPYTWPGGDSPLAQAWRAMLSALNQGQPKEPT